MKEAPPDHSFGVQVGKPRERSTSTDRLRSAQGFAATLRPKMSSQTSIDRRCHRLSVTVYLPPKPAGEMTLTPAALPLSIQPERRAGKSPVLIQWDPSPTRFFPTLLRSSFPKANPLQAFPLGKPVWVWSVCLYVVFVSVFSSDRARDSDRERERNQKEGILEWS